MTGIFRIAAVVALALILAAPAGAFNRELSKTMVEDALAFCPEGLKDYLTPRENLVAKGMMHGDLVSEAVDPMAAQRIFDVLVQRLKAGRQDDVNVIISFGTLAFFLSETVSPGICRTLDPLLPEEVPYDGQDSVSNPAARIQSLLQESKPFHGACDSETVGQAYVIAVNAIVDFWTSACQQAGRDPGLFVDVGAKVDHTRQAMYTPGELAAMAAAEKARIAAQEALDAEMAAMVKKGVITKEVLEWKQQQQAKKEVEMAIAKYQRLIENLENDVSSIHRQGSTNSSEMDRMRDLNAKIFDYKDRIDELQDNPGEALQRERTHAW